MADEKPVYARPILREKGPQYLEASELLIVVASLTRNGGECWASNKWLMKVLLCSERTVQRTIVDLCETGWLIKSGTTAARLLSLGPKAVAILAGIDIPEEGLTRPGRPEAAPQPANDTAPEPAPEPVEKPAEKPVEKPKKERNINPTVEQHAARELPDFISRALWREFVEARHDQHGPFSDGAAKGVIAKIIRLKGEGYCPAKLLTGAIEGRWMSVAENDRFKASASGDRRGTRPDGVTASGARRMGGRIVL
jgi:hypothetical protein